LSRNKATDIQRTSVLYNMSCEVIKEDGISGKTVGDEKNLEIFSQKM
jgi:hypothetical protein